MISQKSHFDLPGFSLPLNCDGSSFHYFPNALDYGYIESDCGRLNVVRDIVMMRVINVITEIDGWHTEVILSELKLIVS